MNLDRLSWFIGEVSRPLSIFIAVLSAAIASIMMAARVTDGNDGYLLAGAIWFGAAVIFGAKAVEEFRKNKNAADVEMARTTGNIPGSAPGPQDVIIKNKPGDPVPVEEAHP